MTRPLVALLLACWPLAGQDRIEVVRVAVIKGTRVIQQNGKIPEPACEEPVIAERIPKNLLETPAPEPRGATIRQVLENRADGTPGEEVLENPEFFEALHTAGTIPDAIAFAKKNHGTLGWLSQDYAGDHILWCHSPSVFIRAGFLPSASLSWPPRTSTTRASHAPCSP